MWLLPRREEGAPEGGGGYFFSMRAQHGVQGSKILSLERKEISGLWAKLTVPLHEIQD